MAFTWGEHVLLPSVGAVQQDSPAFKAGLKPGDQIVAIDGKETKTWQDMSDAIAGSNGRTLSVDGMSQDGQGGGDVRQVEITPVRSQRKTIFGEDETAWLVGVRASGAFATNELSASESITSGWKQCWNMIVLTWEGFVKLIERVVPADQVGGPIMIAQVIGEQAHNGLEGLLGLAALISINLGILNLLPVPVLDGGTCVFCLAEIICRRPVNKKFIDYSMRVGVALLIALMVFATFNDVMRIIRG